MKIIQVISSAMGSTLGLGDDGKLYRWVANGGTWAPSWQEKRNPFHDDAQAGATTDTDTAPQATPVIGGGEAQSPDQGVPATVT